MHFNMTNQLIIDNLSLLGKLMDIHEENSFKAKAYISAAFAIKQLGFELSSFDRNKISTIKGVGSSIGKSVVELLETGALSQLNEYLKITPFGVIEMLNIKGLGPKKIAVIWRELELESLGELLYACNENKLTLYKGFGEKTQQSIKESIEFYLAQTGKLLYAEAEPLVYKILEILTDRFPNEQTGVTGDFRMQMEIIDQIDWVTTIPFDNLCLLFHQIEFTTEIKDKNTLICTNNNNVILCFYYCDQSIFYAKLFETSCSNSFLDKAMEFNFYTKDAHYENEEIIFKQAGLPFIPPFFRESANTLTTAKSIDFNTIIQPIDIKGIIHSHSNWSDGKNTLEQMVEAAIEKGYEYILITDHSKSAFYANGLKEDRIIAQQKQIDEINKKYFPFVVFKGIECDILYDGQLDYNSEILSTFDLVIASVHSNLKMAIEKAMSRLLKAIESPYTSILGHLTGRLLLSRNGYPVNHEIIIDACAANNVVLELNANPRRLDIDWRHIDYALQKNVLLSINPDAHSIAGYDDCRFGVLVAQKAGLPSYRNLSSYSLEDMKEFIMEQHSKR